MTTVEVFMDRDGDPILVGQAHFTRHRSQISTTFLYDPTYLVHGGTSIDPALPLVSGAQHQVGLVRAFADSAPDRWGRNLIEKAERVRARREHRSLRRLDDLDFLLGVSDDTRQGALRYRIDGDGSFVGEPSRVPQLIALPELLSASDRLSSEDDPSAAVKQLLETGTTGLGGARPKASVRLEDGALAIAKFPHSSDRWDMMAWEMTALDLLEAVGIRTPARRLTAVGDRNVLILRRFDRTDHGHRIGYISAMTALGANDGDHRDYAEIAEAIRDLSLSPKSDHRELFDRVVASVVLGNTDDHLRNHGFLADHGSWTLSPAFDVNPNPDPWRPRATSIMGAEALTDEADALLPLAEECGIRVHQARERIRSMLLVMTDWRDVARRHDIREQEIGTMEESIDSRIAAVSAAMR
ncbi:type II toxin-antitoxin system HipA family toxin [Kocuria carniphila]|uniref:type II toxin-antitoxin system HipA family toxin n=2 Tax=Kocuria carniphila TaxID=262208 RepID=UPI00101DC5C0|nr:type II toxin-antitoxin system HipA family toxin [Kocuria carniphila]